MFAAVRAVGPTVLAVGALAWVSSLLSGAAGVDLVVGALLWLLAVAEHVNYHHVQLMHDTRADWRRLRRTRHLRRSFLAADLDRVDRSRVMVRRPVGYRPQQEPRVRRLRRSTR